MDGEKSSSSRRKFLRALGAGGGVAFAGGLGGAVLSEHSGTLARAMDLELFPENFMESGTFELKTAWKLVHSDRIITRPESQESGFPSNFDTFQLAEFPIGNLDPGSSGNLLVAFKLPGNPGTVQFSSTVESTNSVFADAISVDCWAFSGDYPKEDPAGTPRFAGSLSDLDSTPISTKQCESKGGLTMAYQLPAAGDPDVRKIVPSDHVSLNIKLTATQCTRGEQ